MAAPLRMLDLLTPCGASHVLSLNVPAPSSSYVRMSPFEWNGYTRTHQSGYCLDPTRTGTVACSLECPQSSQNANDQTCGNQADGIDANLARCVPRLTFWIRRRQLKRRSCRLLVSVVVANTAEWHEAFPREATKAATVAALSFSDRILETPGARRTSRLLRAATNLNAMLSP